MRIQLRAKDIKLNICWK